MVGKMAQEPLIGLMVLVTQANGKTIRWKEKEISNGPTVDFILENT